MQKTRRDMQRRTRRNASTIGGAAPDTTIDRADADRSGARPISANLFCQTSARAICVVWMIRLALPPFGSSFQRGL